MEQQELFAAVASAVDALDGSKVGELVKGGVDSKVPAIDLINLGLTPGLRALGERFSREECFIPELIMGAKIVSEQIDLLKPLLEEDTETSSKGKFVIGTVFGDIHDLGKNLVKLILSMSGWEIVDLGTNVPNEKFVVTVTELKATWLGMSSLLTTSMSRQKDVIDILKEKGIRDQVHVMIGGAPCSQFWADEIGADAFAADPVEAMKKADEIL